MPKIDPKHKPTNGKYDTRFRECEVGIHFFLERERAANYY